MKKIALLLAAVMLLLASCTPKDTTTLKVAALKGPTAMGMVEIIKNNESRSEDKRDSFSIVSTADEIVAMFAKDEVDIAAVPCNLAAVLNKNIGVKVMAINTLGVLYVIENGTTINSVADLKGKTIVTTGKGTTPEYTINELLIKNGLDPETDVKLEFKSEAAEVTAYLLSGEAAVAVLPQPYVTTVLQKDAKEGGNLRIALDVTEEWGKVNRNIGIVTGVVVVRKAFLEEHESVVKTFLEDYKKSIEYVNSNVKEASALVEANGIAPASVAEEAIPKSHIVYIGGDDMKTAVSSYLKVLFDQNPKSVGGVLPDDSFYWLGK